MRKLAILTFQTLDGVMQAPKLAEEDNSGGFTQGGWANGSWQEVMEQVAREAMAAPYDLLLGRKTYDIFAANHVDSDLDSNPIAKKRSEATKYVVTSGTESLQWQNSVAITGDIASEISKLKKQDGPLLQVHGSWQLIQTLLKHQLVDEFRLWTFPLVMGAGKRLFTQEIMPCQLKLTKFETCPSGAFLSFYKLDI